MEHGKLTHVDYKVSKNFKLRLFPDSYLSYLILRGNFELSEQQFIEKTLKPGDVFIDIGANIGFFSIKAADRVGQLGKVLAFEPTPKTYHRLKSNISFNALEYIIQAHSIAIGAQQANLPLQISDDQFDAWNTLGKPSVEGSFSEVLVPVEPFAFALKQLTEDELSRLKLIKIDVEGFEKFVFEGVFQVLNQIPSCYWMIEFNDENFIPNGYSGKELAESLIEKGFELFTINIDGSLSPLSQIPTTFTYTNIIGRNK